MNRTTQHFPQNEFSRSKRGKSGKFAPVFHSPPVSSSSETTKLKEIEMMMMSPVETCGNVGKKGPAFFTRPRCSRQVYASEAAAEMTIKALAGDGRVRRAERCPTCHLVHVADTSGKPDQP